MSLHWFWGNPMVKSLLNQSFAPNLHNVNDVMTSLLDVITLCLGHVWRWDFHLMGKVRESLKIKGFHPQLRTGIPIWRVKSFLWGSAYIFLVRRYNYILLLMLPPWIQHCELLYFPEPFWKTTEKFFNDFILVLVIFPHIYSDSEIAYLKYGTKCTYGIECSYPLHG